MARNTASGKRWFRSRDGLLGGVCAGVARRFDLDPLVIGILGVMLLLATCGIFGLVYLILWRVLPLEPEKGEPLEVKPDSVLSDTYGELDAAGAEDAMRRDSASAAAQVVAGYATSRPVGSWHLPPEPPAAYHRAASVAPVVSPTAAPTVAPTASPAGALSINPSAAHSSAASAPLFRTDVSRETFAQDSGSLNEPVSNPAAAPSTSSAAAAHPKVHPKAHPVSNTWVSLALWLGFAVMCMVTMAAFGSLFENLYWWQFWPTIFLIAGVASLISPLSRLSPAQRFARSVVELGAGTLLLRASLGISSWESFMSICAALWPLLLCSVAFIALSFVHNKGIFSLVGAGLFALFCILGIMFFSIPGEVSSLTIALPDRDAIVIPIH